MYEAAPRWSNQSLRLYHGTTEPDATDIVDMGIELGFARRKADFGPGFYTTTNLRQARRFARKRQEEREQTAAVLEINVEREALALLTTLSFVLGEPSALDYWSFVNHCRAGHASHRQLGENPTAFYDVVFGPVTKWYQDRTLYAGFDQVSFHTQDAVALLNLPGRRKKI